MINLVSFKSSSIWEKELTYLLGRGEMAAHYYSYTGAEVLQDAGNHYLRSQSFILLTLVYQCYLGATILLNLSSHA
ncbi:hypothetical protein PT276_06640 [Orbaceae bacterium ESL0721]|nr:hypothetical protein [Orbaceae bacterium ESL0721]